MTVEVKPIRSETNYQAALGRDRTAVVGPVQLKVV
jgi:hypothetical protein